MTPERYEETLKEFGLDPRFPNFERLPYLEDDVVTPEQAWAYVLHTAWGARILAKTQPAMHVDISSYIYFVSLVSAFIPIQYYEYRGFDIPLDNLSCKHADLKNLPFEDRSIQSLSCMHTIEHIGLARYGDALDRDGDKKAANELIRVLADGGDLLMVVPVGPPRLSFNAHRIYSYELVIDMFKELRLKEFSLVPTTTHLQGPVLIRNADPALVAQQRDGAGCFWFQRPLRSTFTLSKDQ